METDVKKKDMAGEEDERLYSVQTVKKVKFHLPGPDLLTCSASMNWEFTKRAQ